MENFFFIYFLLKIPSLMDFKWPVKPHRLLNSQSASKLAQVCNQQTFQYPGVDFLAIAWQIFFFSALNNIHRHKAALLKHIKSRYFKFKISLKYPQWVSLWCQRCGKASLKGHEEETIERSQTQKGARTHSGWHPDMYVMLTVYKWLTKSKMLSTSKCFFFRLTVYDVTN